jgi:hypothetical protein
MRKSLFLGVAILAVIVPHLRADEATRRAQEELRKRNLYFGDVDGKMKPELVDALKRYQGRKGFDVTGQLDEATANSLDISSGNSSGGAQSWPDIPVLKSDAARGLSPAEQSALQPKDNVNSEASPAATPATPATATEASFSSEEITQLVRNYLRDAETGDVDLQVGYYAFPVDYFDHGRVDRQFVVRDTRNYVKRWPQRKYMLLEPVTVQPAGANGEARVEFTIAFEVRNKNHAVRGKTRNFWTLQPQAGNLRIVALKEQRLHE